MQLWLANIGESSSVCVMAHNEAKAKYNHCQVFLAGKFAVTGENDSKEVTNVINFVCSCHPSKSSQVQSLSLVGSVE
jgi:hypothetical protein